MQVIQNNLREVLANFANMGWTVDYDDLSMTAVSNLQVEDTKIEHSILFDSDANQFGIHHSVHLQYPLAKSSMPFLRHMRKTFKKNGIDFDWDEESLVDVLWHNDFPDLFEGNPDSSLIDEINQNIRIGRHFFFTCIHVLDMYAQWEKKQKGDLPHHLHPDFQVLFCTLGFDRYVRYHA